MSIITSESTHSRPLKDIIRTIALLFVLQIPSVAPMAKYAHVSWEWFIVYYLCYLIGVGIYYHRLFLISRGPSAIQNILNGRCTLVGLLISLFVMAVLLYHYELVLQTLGRGSDGGEALIIGGYSLLHGHYPYSHLTHLHNPMSPGPGWIMMGMPFTCTGCYVLFTPALLVLSAMVIQKITQSTLNANRYLLCLYASPAFWQDVATGNDYAAMGIVYALITVALFYGWEKKRCYQVLLIALAGFAATARMNFWYVGPLLGFFLAIKSRKAGIAFGVFSLLITLGLHASFFLQSSNHYMPLHVIHGKGGAVLNPSGITTLLVACVIVGIVTRLKLQNRLTSWLFLLWFCLTVPLIILAIFTLTQDHWNIYGDGLSYLLLTAPVLVLWLSIRGTNSNSNLMNFDFFI